MTRHLAAFVGEEVGSETVGYGLGHGGGLIVLCMAGVVSLSVVGMIILACADSPSTPTSSRAKKTSAYTGAVGATAAAGAAAGGGGGHHGGHHGGGHHGGGHHGGGGCGGGGGGGGC